MVLPPDSPLSTKKWSEIRRNRVRRRAYARALLYVVFGGDFASAPFFIKRVVTGDRSPNRA
jgi:hypothetical protein